MTQRQRIWGGLACTLTFLVGVGVGVTGQIEHSKEVRYKTTPSIVNQIANEVWNAQKYADWCGGYVQVIGTDVSVEGCDK